MPAENLGLLEKEESRGDERTFIILEVESFEAAQKHKLPFFRENLCLCRFKRPKFSPLILKPPQEQNGWSKRPGFYERGGSFNTLCQGRPGSSAGISPWEGPFATRILRLNPTFWLGWGMFPMRVTPHCGQEDPWDPSHLIPTRPAQPSRLCPDKH